MKSSFFKSVMTFGFLIIAISLQAQTAGSSVSNPGSKGGNVQTTQPNGTVHTSQGQGQPPAQYSGRTGNNGATGTGGSSRGTPNGPTGSSGMREPSGTQGGTGGVIGQTGPSGSRGATGPNPSPNPSTPYNLGPNYINQPH